MAYIDNTIVEVQCTLTRKGASILAKDPSRFNIIKFAVSDDEVDYDMWNPNHSLGSDYYGEMIDNMPLLEPNPNESQSLKYKLVTLDKNTVKLPVIDVGQTSVVLKKSAQLYTISPSVLNYPDGNGTLGYTAILSDSNLATIEPTPGFTVDVAGTPTVTVEDVSNESITVIGKKFDIKAKAQPFSDGNATVTIIGNETGGIKVINLTVLQETL